ncbi:MAG: carboxyl transferase domain-containing protein [Alcaligenaceae bacterium]
MQAFSTCVDTYSAAYLEQYAAMLKLIAEVRGLQQRTVAASQRSGDRFAKRGQLLPRDRLARLLDPGAPFLELMGLTGYCGIENPDPQTSIPGSAVIAGIGFVQGVRVMIVVNDSAIEAGAMQNMTGRKVIRCQEIALENKLPFIQLVESAGANLLSYRVERFVNSGGMFRNLARLSSAGLPVISAVHGSSTAGGAYLPGLSDYVVMVRGRARAFLAGPPLLKAATGEIATEEELGGADMHATLSGLADFVADDDAHAVSLTRDIVRNLDWNRNQPSQTQPGFAEPLFDADELAGIMPITTRTPVDMHEVIARLVDGSVFTEFRSSYGSATLCIQAFIEGHAVAFISNNGPIDPHGATKAAQFIQLCDQAGTSIVYLQNTTGFIVGRASEEAGMIKHGSKMIQALSNARVPQITVLCASSYGAGHYGMCGRAFGPRFVFSWPNAKTAVMGGQQAADTMEIVALGVAARRGVEPDLTAIAQQKEMIIDNFDRQAGAIHTSSLMLDDGLIDPRDTRQVLALTLATCREAQYREPHRIQYGVARF